MKRTKTSCKIALLLLFAVMLTSCGRAETPATAGETAKAAEEMVPTADAVPMAGRNNAHDIDFRSCRTCLTECDKAHCFSFYHRCPKGYCANTFYVTSGALWNAKPFRQLQ